MSGTASFIVATAGHVDHGKSALVKALTGIDPDRLPEEKARGITIDLGFAALDVPAGSGSTFRLGIVDVPGHEDFVKNMVAGVGAADLALLIVAADDGWMPQTEEHLQVLMYFGVRRMIVALTKVDLASDLEQAAAAVRQRLRGTPFARAIVVPTSIVSGRGIEDLKSAIARELAATQPSRDIGKPRLPIDRVFTLTGIGTVVTGTVLGGTFLRGQQVVVQPTGKTTRIRRMQSHNQDVEVSGPGTRSALNLPDLGADDVRRGDVVTLAAFGGPSATLDVLLEISSRANRSLRNGTRIRMHYGSGNVAARVAFFAGDELVAGGRMLAQLRLERPVFLFDGDRVTVRDWAEQHTLAGGIVLDADAGRKGFRGRARLQCLTRRTDAAGDAIAFVESLVTRDGVVQQSRLLVKSGFGEAEITDAVLRLAAAEAVVVAGGCVCSARTWATLRQQAVDAVEARHQAHPDRLGLPLSDLRARLKAVAAPDAVFDAVVEQLCAGEFIRDGAVLRRAAHRPALPAALETAGSALRATLASRPFDPPSRRVLTPDAMSERALRFLLEGGEAIEISADVVLAAASVTRAREAVVALIRDRGHATIGDVRQLLGSSRRVVVPLLEYFDRIGVTLREGDRRTLRR